MKQYESILQSTPLFADISSRNLWQMLDCLSAKKAVYQKDEIILLAGEMPTYVGIVLSGNIQIIKENSDGERTLLSTLFPSDLFAEAICYARVPESPVSVLAGNEVTVLLLRFSRITKTCQNSCPFHHKLIENMLAVMARKNLFLQSRMEITSLKSIRAKVIAYLKSLSLTQGTHIEVPMNREEMATYLCVERSALSHELMKMKKDGLLSYRKNQFELL